MAAASAAGPLLHDQRAVAQVMAPANRAAHIPLRGTPIAVEQDLHRGAGGILIVFTPEGQSVKGADGHILKRHIPDLLHKSHHGIPVVNIDGFVGNIEFVRGHILTGGVEGHTVADVSDQHNDGSQNRSSPQQAQKQGHSIPSHWLFATIIAPCEQNG